MVRGPIRIFRKNQIPYLRWMFEDRGDIPRPDGEIPLLFISILLAVIFFSILIFYREYLRIFWIFALGVGIISAAVGVFLGSIGESAFYNLDSGDGYMASWVGSIWGFVMGAAFVGIIGKIYKKYNSRVSMAGYATDIGAITGVVASSIIHGYLMIAYEEKSFVYMAAGSCFGIVVGILIGWISSGIIRFYKIKIAG